MKIDRLELKQKVIRKVNNIELALEENVALVINLQDQVHLKKLLVVMMFRHIPVVLFVRHERFLFIKSFLFMGQK